MNKDFSVLIPDYLLEKGEKEFLISEVIQKGYIENYETERKTKKNEIINVSMSRFAIYDGQSEMIASVGIIRDLTKIKTLEKELQERERLALIGEVVASIAHTLSNPLNIISGNADYLLLEKKSTDSEYEELKTILDETTRITKSIRHLLNFSRPLKVNKSFNDLNKLVGKVISNSKYLKDKKKIVFEKILDKDLPEFEFDISEIEEVFNNLITNAIQAIPSKGKIKITTEKTGAEIIITITDSGRGIPKENLSKIFQPFFSSKEYGKGTGLGLSLSKQIIRGHGGDINVKSTVGKGSTFIINLPYNGNKINQV
jgi:two-component system sensor histidine kinase HydH